MNPTTYSLNTLKVSFDHHLRPHQLPQWRGAIAEAAGWEQDLFHNHDNTLVMDPATEADQHPEAGNGTLTATKVLKDRYFYRYPLIQYRVDDGKATIFALGAGTKVLRQWLLRQEGPIRLQGRQVPLRICGMQEKSCTLRMLPEMKGYRLMDYVPFKQENYKKWQQAEDLFERMILLQKMVEGHILAFGRSIGWDFPEFVEAKLMNLRSTRTVMLHGIPHLGFNLVFKCNVQLPPDIALGRAVSHGFGRLRPTRGKM